MRRTAGHMIRNDRITTRKPALETSVRFTDPAFSEVTRPGFARNSVCSTDHSGAARKLAAFFLNWFAGKSVVAYWERTRAQHVTRRRTRQSFIFTAGRPIIRPEVSNYVLSAMRD